MLLCLLAALFAWGEYSGKGEEEEEGRLDMVSTPKRGRVSPGEGSCRRARGC